MKTLNDVPLTWSKEEYDDLFKKITPIIAQAPSTDAPNFKLPKKKVLIVDAAKSKWGKTSAIKFLDNYFQTVLGFSPIYPVAKGATEILNIYKINGKVLVIFSMGDPCGKSGHKNLNQQFAIYLAARIGANIIIGASRTYGDTVNNVESVAKIGGYMRIWCQNPHYGAMLTASHGSPIAGRTNLNEIWSQYILEILHKI